MPGRRSPSTTRSLWTGRWRAPLAVALLAPLLIGLGAASSRRVVAGPSDWEQGPPSDPSHFPLAVWLQSPGNAEAYRAIGINLYVGLWQGPTEAQLAELAAAGMPVMADQNALGLAHRADPILQGWLQPDEPDNAQPDGQGGYGPCVDPASVQARYARMRQADPSRPVFLNLGQGLAWDRDQPYVGRGSACAGRWDHYPEYARGSDILSFDIYPVTSPYPQIQGQLWRVALGVDRLREWAGPDKILWNAIETTHINSERMPSPAQVRAEVWMSIVHGSRGILYFAHEWQPSFREAGLLHYPEMRAGVAAINREVTALAPAIHAPADPGAVRARASDPELPIDILVTHADDATYVFAVSMRDRPSLVRFELAAAPGAAATVEAIGEDRRIAIQGGRFEDRFAGYAVHLYRLPRLADARLMLPWLRR
ncbi:MAG: hypothetical protein H6648_07655 [Caldilineae bacterium]|nr:hypothetical protein [Chloroflexota bacterium]MCB9177019.1 hypothetical protein [Caldilineae bacterium]